MLLRTIHSFLPVLINLDVTMVSDTAEAGGKDSVKRSDSSTPSLC